ncbi:acyl-CoA dehydrogenase family protein [Myxococcus sp. MISCRS1]|uniref:acyl-CoA dehydrogenase family protein n=1 Tax=Myxococcus sp. MISCRS1 TaxID=2996786 RepID=UPI002271D745|nr:acyl-CoA dehydrogenase family protein [Myxococcus sp. MISCRS1]MCY0998224.1 acyl-CoA dehydrogenase family protein [Myxococcus sp. MISCRS1]
MSESRVPVAESNARERESRFARLFAAEVFRQREHQTLGERARHAYRQLQEVHRGLGSGKAIAQDLPSLFALFEWSAMLAPELFLVLSGHFNLTLNALLSLGRGRTDLEDYLRELDSGDSVGVFLLTELGYGSTVFSLETEAEYDHDRRGFWLTTPRDAALKFMPNVGAEDVPKLVVIAARLKVAGEDQGVFPFILRLRGKDGGLHQGVRVVPQPERPLYAMDNAMIGFDRVWLSFRDWLPGDAGSISEQGVFHSDYGKRERFRRTVEMLQTGRVALACGTVASARASLSIALSYARQRRVAVPDRGTAAMLDCWNVQHDLLVGLARIHACTLFGRFVQERFSEEGDEERERLSLLAMLLKPYISRTAFEIIQTCRERCGAQGMFGVNRIPEYLGTCQAVMTAEGENQVLQLTAARRLVMGEHLWTPSEGTDAARTEGSSLFAERARRLRTRIAQGLEAPLGPGEDRFERWNAWSTEAIALAEAQGEALALECLQVALRAEVPSSEGFRTASAVLRVFVADGLRRHAGWFQSEGLLGAEEARRLDVELREACVELLPHVPRVLESFALPEALREAPIAAPEGYVEAWARRFR